MGDIVDRAVAAAEQAAMSERSEIWITLVDPAEVALAASDVERRLAAGEHLELAGLTVAVKDNIDIDGMPTTAGCPAFAYLPSANAPAVQALFNAGAIVLGKTNMDQFATGLVGTRSPYGIVRNAIDPRYVAGGSSSGSAVAVALGLVDLALGTDTAGSGRVPAAFNGIVGLKPTRGLISTEGVVPACASLDCVSILATEVGRAFRAFELLTRSKHRFPFQRSPRDERPNELRIIGVPDISQLELDDERRQCFLRVCGRFAALGIEVAEIELTPLLKAGSLLYGGALVAERYAAIGKFVDAHPDELDPVVREIVLASAAIPAHQLAADQFHLASLRASVAETLCRIDAIALPSTPFHPTIAEVMDEPFATNERLGLYNTFCNPLDLCALTLPAGECAGGLPFGITLYGPAFADRRLADFGRRFLNEDGGEERTPAQECASRRSTRKLIAVVGLHLRGQPLNAELVGRGGQFLEQTKTSAMYRLFALSTEPQKPALVRSTKHGSSIEVELWSLDDAAFADFVCRVPLPMAIGPVELEDGRWITGFLCQPSALDDAREITEFGGWRVFLASTATAGAPSRSTH